MPSSAHDPNCSAKSSNSLHSFDVLVSLLALKEGQLPKQLAWFDKGEDRLFPFFRQVVQDRRWVSFMYSYPNLIPLPASTIYQIIEAVEPFEFDRIYGAWWGKTVFSDAKAAVKRSAERYIRAISE